MIRLHPSFKVFQPSWKVLPDRIQIDSIFHQTLSHSIRLGVQRGMVLRQTAHCVKGPQYMVQGDTQSPLQPEFGREMGPTIEAPCHKLTNYKGKKNVSQNLAGAYSYNTRLLGSLLQSLNTVHGMNTSGNHPTLGGPPASFPFQFLTQLLNPANAASGDAVYTEEALDRVITQFMEQANGSSAPGPASAEAIQGLPKKKVDKSMMGSDGKAECSVCMDSVEIGDEITVLPCSHWFHGDCVGAWLKEHDTCPHCRQGIMPKENAGGRGHSHAHAHAHVHTPRGPRQPAQRQATPPPPPPLPPPSFSNGSGANMTHGLHFSWQPGSPPVARQMELPLRPSEHHRRRSTPREGRNGGEGSGGGGRGGGGGGGGREGGGGGSERGGGREREGGFGNWMRDRWSRTNGDRH